MQKTALYKITVDGSTGKATGHLAWESLKGDDAFCPAYTALCAFTCNGRAVLLGHDPAEQTIDAYQLALNSKGFESRQRSPLDGAYDAIQVFPVAGRAHLLAYARQQGILGFYSLAPDLSLARIFSYRRTYGTTTQGFTTIIPYNYRGLMLLLGYNGETGTAVTYQISVTAEDPLHLERVWTGQWADGWTRFAFFQLGEENFFLKSNPKHHNVNIDHLVDDPGKGSHPVGTHLPLDLSLDAVATFSCNHWPYFASYRATQGMITLNRIHADCRGWQEEAVFAAVPAGGHLLPLAQAGSMFLLVY